MLNDQDSNMAANAICHSAAMVQGSFADVAFEMMRPAVLFQPKLYRDGSQWCDLLGDDLQVGVCGFGDSPAEAMFAFDKDWNTKIPQQKS